jgi:hypothetical protein
MQSCARQMISSIGRSAIVGRCSYHMSSTIKKTPEQEHHDNVLICPAWEEALIKEHRKPDVPFDSMQKDTIEKMSNNQSFEEQLHANMLTESST